MSKRNVRVCVISDVHLGFLGSRAGALSRYLGSIQPEILILNGDIIDMWQFRSYYFPTDHQLVLQTVLRMMSEGTRVYYLTGNHDEALRKYSGFTAGNFSLEDKLLLDLDGKTYWFFHGDVFDISMQGSRWPAKLGSTGYELLILLNKGVNALLVLMGRERISFSKRIKEATKRGIKKLGNYELTSAEIAIENGYHAVVNGHVHVPVIKTIETEKGKTLYMNSGDWVEHMTSLEYHDGEWQLHYFEDKVEGGEQFGFTSEDVP